MGGCREGSKKGRWVGGKKKTGGTRLSFFFLKNQKLPDKEFEKRSVKKKAKMAISYK